MPLESNPNVVNKYLCKLGFDKRFSIHELLSLEDWALDMVPRPVRAIFLLFPIGKETEALRKEEEAEAKQSEILGNVVHMKQLIGNACGTIAVVHAMANLCRHGDATPEPDSWLERFLVQFKEGMDSDDVGQMLEEDAAIEAAHAEAERESEARDRSSNKNLHFIAFVDINNTVVELDGRRPGPVSRNNTCGDFLSATVQVIREKYMNISPDAMRFNMMALCGGSMPNAGEGGGYIKEVVISDEAIAQLVMFGFDRDTARGALEATGGDVEAAANMLLG